MKSILTSRAIHISEIRSNSENPGIKDFEVSFLRLVERLTNGTLVEISYTGTEVYVRPGLVVGGKIVHDCPNSRAVGWFLEPLLVLGLFGKQPLNITLRGITSNTRDVSADTLRTAYLPLLSTFIPSTVTQPLELRIVKRGLLPGGGGEITYISPSIRAVKPGYNFIQPGSINKIRGIAHAVRVSPTFSQRLVNGAKEVLTPLCSDCRIYTDVYRGAESGKSPGFGLTLVATSTTTAIHSSEAISTPPPSASNPDPTSQSAEATKSANKTPEELGAQAAFELLENISRNSCIDKGMEWLVCLLIALGSEDVGRVRIAGPLDASLVRFLRDLKDFFGVTMKIRAVDDPSRQSGPQEGSEIAQSDAYILSCVGIGYSNIAKKTT